MRVRDWQDILENVVDSNADAGDWRAVAGDRRGGPGEDMFLGHPSVGVFQLKTFAKNPYEVQGVGSRIARSVDEELDPLFPGGDAGGRFGVNDGVEDADDATHRATELEAVLETHADAPTTPDALFEDVMDALDSPAYGPMAYDVYDRPDDLDSLTESFEEAEAVLTSELEDLIEDSDVGRGFH